jgi:hypothetical protein
MTKRLFDHDPLTGITEWFEYDDTDGSFTIQTSQNVDGLIALNQAHQREFNRPDDRWGDGIDHRTKVASIPLNVWQDLRKRGITPQKDPVAFKRWLNDPDNFAFRTRPGRV